MITVTNFILMLCMCAMYIVKNTLDSKYTFKTVLPTLV